MARNESDREDLMQEAVSLIRRIECDSSSSHEPIVVGINSFEWLFVYVGNDVMYRFDEHGRLRRAFVDGMLYRTQGTALAMLERQRTWESEEFNAIPKTTLVRRDLASGELEVFRQRMHRELAVVCEAIQLNGVTRQHPPVAPAIAEEMQQGIRRVLEARELLAPTIVRR